MEKLTKKQAEMLVVIKKFMAEKGYAPTVREIGQLMNLTSSATVFVHLRHLIAKQYLTQTSNKFRTLEILVPNEYAKKEEDVTMVPLLGKVAAGNPIEAIENPTEFISLPSFMIPKNSDVFTLHVNGDSMINAGIFDDDIVIVKKQNTARNGDLVVAMTDENTVTLKNFYKEKGHFRLQPQNDSMSPIILNKVEILGIATGLYRKF